MIRNNQIAWIKKNSLKRYFNVTAEATAVIIVFVSEILVIKRMT